jgi:hypothetical protein
VCCSRNLEELTNLFQLEACFLRKRDDPQAVARSFVIDTPAVGAPVAEGLTRDSAST